LENNTDDESFNDLYIAERKYLESSNSKLIRISRILVPLFILLSLIFLSKYRNLINLLSIGNSIRDNDSKVLGHFPYPEVKKENLVEIQPYIYVHKYMYKSLMKMKDDAERDGVYLTFLSGYRSIKLQKDIFYSLKSSRNQVASERAKVSAPPGYSEHSTGFAIDIGDSQRKETDFEVEFENTDAFRWLKNNAAKYHFRLSFDKGHQSVEYEPWHWRYEGSIEALRIFEASDRKSQ